MNPPSKRNAKSRLFQASFLLRLGHGRSLCIASCFGVTFFGHSLAQDSQKTFFLPKNPVAAAYVLGRLSNQELIAAPRSEFVYIALLQRPGIDPKYKLEALQGLSKIHDTDSLTELLSVISDLDKKGEASISAIRELVPIFSQFKPEELSVKRAILEKLSTGSQLPLSRQLGFAGLITADKSLEKTWKSLEEKPDKLADVVIAIPLLRDAALRASAFPKLEPLVRRVDAPELRKAAISTIVSIPGREADAFKLLATLFQANTERSTTVASLQKIPQSFWPKDSLGTLVNALADYLKNVPESDRARDDFAAALQFANDLALALPPDEGAKIAATLRTLGPTIVILHAVYEQLRYDKQLIVVEPARPVILILQNDDAMPHNVAVLAPGALEEIGVAAEKMPAETNAQGLMYIPDSPKVLHATKLAAPGQKVQLSFNSPAEPGEYPYVCTFPGHWRRMTGTLVVTKDPAAYVAAHADSQPTSTEWKLADLVPELSKISSGRDLPNGKKFFTQLACAQCHKLGEEGYAYGPDLNGVFARYTNDPAAVLQQILEPSKQIEERYRQTSFDLKDGEPVTGMVLKEDAQSVTVQSGPADSLIQKLAKADILKRQPQTSSPMPVGLLNNLSKEQILDLLAYIQSGAAPQAHEHGPH